MHHEQYNMDSQITNKLHRNLKTTGLLIIVLIFFSGFNLLYSNTNAGITQALLLKDIESQNAKELHKWYEEGKSLYSNNDFLSAETVFLKTIKLAEYLNEKEILSYSYYFLGRIESWKSNFPQAILYYKKARSLFYKQENLEYVANSNNQIAKGFEALGEYDSTIAYLKINIIVSKSGGLISGVFCLNCEKNRMSEFT